MQTRSAPRNCRIRAVPRASRFCASACTADFCTATCPTYVLLGDELDSPARPHLLDQGDARERHGPRRADRVCTSTAAFVPRVHDDVPLGRPLPAPHRSRRVHVEKTYRRPLRERALRWSLGKLLPEPEPGFGSL